MLSNSVKVHGSPSKPELILNGRQQANLLYRLARQNPVATSNNNALGGAVYWSAGGASTPGGLIKDNSATSITITTGVNAKYFSQNLSKHC